MALKAMHLGGGVVPGLDPVGESPKLHKGPESVGVSFKPARFTVIGHRGKGMNALSSPDRRLMAVKENSVLSFNQAGRFPVDFVEFDVQVTKDGYPIIFHDNFILTEENGNISERRVTELCLEEFLSYGPQKDSKKTGKSLHRKTKDGRLFSWKVEDDDSLCTLQEVFQHVDSHLGFNIELKFDDHIVYHEEELTHSLQHIMRVVFEHAKERPIIFSSFQPDAAQLIRKLQSVYPVFFLTNGGNEIYSDPRRNSLDEAIRLCVANGLQGIVSEVRGVFRNPSLIPKIKESNLGILTYGQLNNVPRAVYVQHLMGIDGVIVDLVEDITRAVSDFGNLVLDGEVSSYSELKMDGMVKMGLQRSKFSQQELTFLLELIHEVLQH